MLSTPHRDAHVCLNKDEQKLKDVIMVLGNIKSKLDTHDTRLEEKAAPEVLLRTTDKQPPGPSHNANERDVLELPPWRLVMPSMSWRRRFNTTWLIT